MRVVIGIMASAGLRALVCGNIRRPWLLPADGGDKVPVNQANRGGGRGGAVVRNGIRAKYGVAAMAVVMGAAHWKELESRLASTLPMSLAKGRLFDWGDVGFRADPS